MTRKYPGPARVTRRALHRAALVLALLAPGTPLAAADHAALPAPGEVLLIRHALAPGTGDPHDFTLGDRTTQRNLDARGRRQAEAIGGWLRARGFSATVYTSQWCRCVETAERMAVGPVLALPALNSFYEQPRERAGRLATLRAFFDRRTAGAAPVVMVTHAVTIAAVTGEFVGSGEGVIVTPGGEFPYPVVRRVAFAARGQ